MSSKVFDKTSYNREYAVESEIKTLFSKNDNNTTKKDDWEQFRNIQKIQKKI